VLGDKLVLRLPLCPGVLLHRPGALCGQVPNQHKVADKGCISHLVTNRSVSRNNSPVRTLVTFPGPEISAPSPQLSRYLFSDPPLPPALVSVGAWEAPSRLANASESPLITTIVDRRENRKKTNRSSHPLLAIGQNMAAAGVLEEGEYDEHLADPMLAHLGGSCGQQ
jgi:hypothetical protein